MAENERTIETAKDFDSAIEIIPQNVCEAALIALELELDRNVGHKTKDVVMIPILEGGKRVGNALLAFSGFHSTTMQMAHTNEENSWLTEPICIIPPDINQILAGGLTRDVYFAEGVVETEETILASMAVINQLIDAKSREDKKVYKYPNYHTYALISKVADVPKIPNFIYPLWVNPEIWVHGWGVDNSKKGRELNSIFGVISKNATQILQRPYYRTTGVYQRWEKSAIFANHHVRI